MALRVHGLALTALSAGAACARSGGLALRQQHSQHGRRLAAGRRGAIIGWLYAKPTMTCTRQAAYLGVADGLQWGLYRVQRLDTE